MMMMVIQINNALNKNPVRKLYMKMKIKLPKFNINKFNELFPSPSLDLGKKSTTKNAE